MEQVLTTDIIGVRPKAKILLKQALATEKVRQGFPQIQAGPKSSLPFPTSTALILQVYLSVPEEIDLKKESEGGAGEKSTWRSLAKPAGWGHHQ